MLIGHHIADRPQAALLEAAEHLAPVGCALLVAEFQREQSLPALAIDADHDVEGSRPRDPIHIRLAVQGVTHQILIALAVHVGQVVQQDGRLEPEQLLRLGEQPLC